MQFGQVFQLLMMIHLLRMMTRPLTIERVMKYFGRYYYNYFTGESTWNRPDQLKVDFLSSINHLISSQIKMLVSLIN